ncbi:putative wlm domain-containing protein [Neofusicoccum parvum UCRNP2]|uniref:Putative wlm domain-containing protein n=1 Tax=Botryosphaeria parva (strain UCR-NP2) TaxID=1287680 RepID=R1H3F6_BOTPV|nr:putative wlm domain-containing protein [Neofusicoccum parvum UCRNP2]
MPLGFERLNERTSRPNALINFIKPLPGPSATAATRILNRVAARCYPIMKANHIAVMALEEYAPNPEFVGRNFNAGEVIQLVLRSRDGRWLSVKQVEMVMMHELAHCKQMNHSRFFWRVRDAYAGELRGLWVKGYTGEGLWGRGRELDGGGVVNEDELVDIEDVENLCGGTYRSRGKKRKRGGKDKPQLSYAERQQRRILKKFGAGGTALGGDEMVKAELEDGKKTKGKGKPRVASSARGRELRAAAALARFDKPKDEEKEDAVKKIQDESDTESDDGYDAVDGPAAFDFDGKEMRDDKGNGLVKVCEDEDQDDVHVKQEMDELRELHQEKITKFVKKQPPANKGHPVLIDLSEDDRAPPKKNQKSTHTADTIRRPKTSSKPVISTTARKTASKSPSSKATTDLAKPATSSQPSANLACSVCSLVNESAAFTCAACGNVLKPKVVAGSWKCQSLTCRGGAYVNAGDSRRCGVCGAAKEVQ